jgi:hypothetical protein
MPPRINSRYQFCTGLADSSGRLFLSEREPFRFQELDDNIQHQVTGGESLWALAAKYYGDLPDPDQLWWIIADFQPDPILDPTIALLAGQTLLIPSVRTVRELIFSEARSDL